MLYSGDKIEKNKMGWACTRTEERRGVYIGFWRGTLRERARLVDPSVDGRIIFRWIFRKWDVGVWTGSSWLRIGKGGEYL